MRVYFHGDVVLRQIAKIPDDARKVKRTQDGYILARGEVTGHFHAIQDDTSEVYERNGVFYLKVPEPTEIFHQEHNKEFTNIITKEKEKVAPAEYEIDFPQEYDHFAEEARRVAD